MALKIPSKDIFEITNSKVIDNQINRIEMSAKVPIIINDTENVHNEKVMGEYYNGTLQDDFGTWGFVNSIAGNIQRVGANIAYVRIEPEYITKTITIPVHNNNGAVTRLLTLTNENGEPNIKYSISGTVKNGTQSASVPIISISGSQVNLGQIVLNDPVVLKVSKQSYVIPTDEVSITERHDFGGLGGSSIPATASQTPNDLTNVASATATPTDDKTAYEITLTILCGLKIIACKGYYDAPSYGTAYLSGTYEEYIPTQINISFYGDTIKLDLTDKTLSIGDGEQTYSFEGNELMQTTNSPSIETTYSKVLAQYKNGKELAEIRCAITDYYDEGILSVSPYSNYVYNNPLTIKLVNKVSPNKYEVRIYTASGQSAQIPQGDIVYYQNEGASVGEENHITHIYDLDVKQNGKIANLLDTVGELIVNYDEPPKLLPMSIPMGEKVVPYVYGVNGQDRPMSRKEDGTPKEFEVIGKKIIYDGGISQRITCQEITDGSDNPYNPDSPDNPDTPLLENEILIHIDSVEANVSGFGFTVVDYNGLTITASYSSANSKLFFHNSVISIGSPYFSIPFHKAGTDEYSALASDTQAYNQIAQQVGQTIKMQLYTGTLT